MNKTMNKAMNKAIESIAKRVLRLDTLETRNNDSDDFRDQAVWNIKDALTEAYEKGMKAGVDKAVKDAKKFK